MKMEELDTEKLSRVWNRVKGTDEQDDLKQMLALSRTAAVHCEILARNHIGFRNRILRQMALENRTAEQSLLGICALTGCRYPAKTHKLANRPVRQQLLDCYTRQQQLCSLYNAHAADPQFGHIYSRLGQQAAGHCQNFLQLLGSQPQKSPR